MLRLRLQQKPRLNWCAYLPRPTFEAKGTDVAWSTITKADPSGFSPVWARQRDQSRRKLLGQGGRKPLRAKKALKLAIERAVSQISIETFGRVADEAKMLHAQKWVPCGNHLGERSIFMKLVKTDAEQISLNLAILSFLFDLSMSIIRQVIIKNK